MSRILLSLLLSSGLPLAAQTAELKKGDHIAFIGNNFADRAQHYPYFEALLHTRFPDYDLVVRNLGFPGDELKRRDREDNFGSPDEWLTQAEADVVFAFFGYNEALKGKDGLESFKKDLADFIAETVARKYNGKTSPRLVLFSPIAREETGNPNLPEATAYNADLALYTNAMKQVAAEKTVPFVDLFHPSLAMFAREEEPLTINSVHLTEAGYRTLAGAMDEALFGPTSLPSPNFQKVEAAVRDKNLHWWSRYRTVDGYNVYGGRSGLSWHGQSNADVMKREMEIFDVMTANRDQAIWAAARGKEHLVDDSNTPPLLETKTNRPGQNPDGSFPYLGGEEAISKMHVHEKLQVNLFASEEQFPDLINPVQMAVDTDSRLWVATWPSYPHWNPKEPMNDKLLILPDENGDGKADKVIVFADQLNSITGFDFWGGGVLACVPPEILFLQDTDGDDRADVKIRVLQGVSSADTHHSANNCVIGPDGGLYFSRGIFNTPNFETPTKTYRPRDSGVYRFDPRTYEVDFIFPIGPNPHGNSFDRYGYQFATDGTGGSGNYVGIGDGTGAHKQLFQQRVRPVPSHTILSSSHFPPEFEGNFLIANAIGFLGVANHRWEWNGSDPTAVEIDPIVFSDDGNFRPTDLEVGGDGALYVSDWQNALIGHMQHNMRDPNRDHKHGRVYRLTAKGRPLLTPVKMKGKPITEVLANFAAPENGTRYRARLELSGRDAKEATDAAAKWAATLDPTDPVEAHALLECLWVHEEARIPNLSLANKVRKAAEPKIRAAVIRTLGHWAAKDPDGYTMILDGARDGSPLVRAEAAKAARSFEDMQGAEILFEVATRPTDPHLDHVLGWATGKINLNGIVEASLNGGKQLSGAGYRYMLKNSSVAVLLKMERTREVCVEILQRPGVAKEDRLEALTTLGKLLAKTRAVLVLDLIKSALPVPDSVSRKGYAAAPGLLADYAALFPALEATEINEVRQFAENMSKASEPELRAAGIAALVNAGDSARPWLTGASESPESFSIFLAAIPHLRDETARKDLYTSLRLFAFELPKALQSAEPQADPNTPGVSFDWYPGSPGNALPATFEKLKPHHSGEIAELTHNVPGHEGDAFGLVLRSNLIVTTPGEYTFFLASDDGSRLTLDGQELINNDGLHGMGEKSASVTLSAGAHPLVVTYFDNSGGDGLAVSWQGPGIGKQTISKGVLARSGGSDLRVAVARTIATLPADPDTRFGDMIRLLSERRATDLAIAHLAGRSPADWPKNQLNNLATALATSVPETPIELRNTPLFQQSLELGRQLAPLLPGDQAAVLNKALSDLDLAVIRINTIPEKMLYDRRAFTAKAGKPVQIIFHNPDALPHNLVIAQPGTSDSIAAAAIALGAKGPDLHYIPEHPGILHHTRMLNKGETETLTFTAPSEPGNYDVVCTFPGHNLLMNARMRVVE